ncbi:hypothetical protein YQE_08588, partial [Dendroctonus ponderosae]
MNLFNLSLRRTNRRLEGDGDYNFSNSPNSTGKEVRPRLKTDSVYKEGYDETFMFHGTKQDFLDGICTFNFDRSKIRKHKFGCGISFATKPFYATRYHHDNKRRLNKVMIIAKVLVGHTFEIGNQTMTIPKKMCYTSKNFPQTVIVKYDDHTFLPVAIVHYQGFHDD